MALGPRLVIVAYFFPPSGGAGVQRPLQWVKYLARLGWRCEVITVRDGYYFATDASLCDDVPSSVQVHRTWSIEPGRLRPLRKARATQESAAATPRRSPAIRALQALRPWVLVPDPQIGWLPFAAAQTLKVLQSEPSGSTVLLTTSTPFTDHLIGLLSAARVGGKIPWVADFRDAWVGNPHRKTGPERIDRALEARVVKTADHVITTCPTVTELLRDRHLPAQPQRFSTIYNGYDPALFPQPAPASPAEDGPWEILHTGVLYGARNPSAFLEALAMFLAKRRAPDASPPRVRVRFVGQLDRKLSDEMPQQIERLGLFGVVELLPYQNHETIVRWLLQSHLLLLISSGGAESQLEIPGKLYEYLAARRSILALIEPGPAAEIIASSQTGVRANPDDPQAICEALEERYRDHLERGSAQRGLASEIEQYARSAQVEQLDRLLKGLLEARR